MRRKIVVKGGQAQFIRTDVNGDDSARRCVDTVVSHVGRLDALFNIACGSSMEDAPAPDADLGILDATLSLDLKGIFLMCRHAIPCLTEAGGPSPTPRPGRPSGHSASMPMSRERAASFP